MSTHQLLEYGESREGYWTSEKFMKQIKKAVDNAEGKYPRKRDIDSFGSLIKAHAILPTMKKL